MTEMVLKVQVTGLAELRETVALLKELKELGAGNPDILSEVIQDGAVIPKVLLEVEKPWYPDARPWVEHDGKSVPSGRKFLILLRSERESKEYYGSEHCWYDEFLWSGREGDNIVAYIKVKD